MLLMVRRHGIVPGKKTLSDYISVMDGLSEKKRGVPLVSGGTMPEEIEIQLYKAACYLL